MAIVVERRTRNEITTEVVTVSTAGTGSLVDQEITTTVTTVYGDGTTTTVDVTVDNLTDVEGTVGTETETTVTNSSWSAWDNDVVDSVTDGTFTDEDLIQYRTANTANVPIPDLTEIVDSALDEPNSITIDNITSNVQIQTDENGDKYTTGDGYFDELMESINIQLKAQYDSGRITGPVYAKVYTALFQTAMGQAVQFALNKRTRELATDTQAIDLAKKALELDVMDATQQTKVDQQAAQLLKTYAETDYIAEQETQLINSVDFNNKIKAIDAMGDTYGTFGAGGLTVSSDMWSTYFGLINTLTNSGIPTSTTVTKVS